MTVCFTDRFARQLKSIVGNRKKKRNETDWFSGGHA
jgi:hypothetical protein